jgi:hypothetical protein
VPLASVRPGLPLGLVVDAALVGATGTPRWRWVPSASTASVHDDRVSPTSCGA